VVGPSCFAMTAASAKSFLFAKGKSSSASAELAATAFSAAFSVKPGIVAVTSVGFVLVKTAAA